MICNKHSSFLKKMQVKKMPPSFGQQPLGEKVNISGGKTINPGKFSRVINKNILNRLEKNAMGNVWQADLRAEGIKNSGQPPPIRTCPSCCASNT